MTIKICLLSRLTPPNIGHTLMHVGVEKVVHRAYEKHEIEVLHIEQHFPLHKIYPKWNPIGWTDTWPAWLPQAIRPRLSEYGKSLLARPDVSRYVWNGLDEWVAKVNLAIACGGPSLIGGMAKSGQIKLMMHHLNGAFVSKGIPLLNLSVGSCYPFRNPPAEILDSRDRECANGYIRNSTLTTVRDRVAQSLLRSLDAECPLLPCPAFLHGDDQISYNSGGYIVINYMDRWPLSEAHQMIQDHPQIENWTRAITHIIAKFKHRYKFVFVCHNRLEVKLAQQIDSSIEFFEPRTSKEYSSLAAGAVAGIVCRIHAAIPLASAGVSSIVIGGDTRLGTVQAIGLPVAYVEDVTPEWLENSLMRIVANHKSEKDRFAELKRTTLDSYVSLFQQYIQ